MHIRRIIHIACAAALISFAACEDSKKSDDDQQESKDDTESNEKDTESESKKVTGGDSASSGDESQDGEGKNGAETTGDNTAVAEAPITPDLSRLNLGDLLPKGTTEGGGNPLAAGGTTAAGGSGSCDTLAPKVCEACGADSGACKGWTKAMDMPMLKTQMAGQCGQVTAAIDQLASIPQAKASFCATDPMGAAAAAAGSMGEPAESCTKLVDALCDTCGADTLACTSFKQVAEMPGALAAMPASSCDMLVKQLPMVVQVPQTKEMFCGTDFIGAAQSAISGAGGGM